MTHDPYQLTRFIEAQNRCYAQVLKELEVGQKRTHWMWFIFPQLLGLGRSDTAQFYAIKSAGEAVAYIHHPVLGERYRTCVEKVMSHSSRGVRTIFGVPDCLKFHSSITLFLLVAKDDKLLKQAVDVFFGGKLDEQTVGLVSEKFE